MSKKNLEIAKSTLVFTVDPTECPFREFRDNELATELWGLVSVSVFEVDSTKCPFRESWRYSYEDW